MDFSLLRRFVPSSITDWCLITNRNCLPFANNCVPPVFISGVGRGGGGGGYVSLIVVFFCFVLFSFSGLVSNVVCVSGLSIFDRSFGFLLRLLTCDTANKISLQYDIE